MSNKKRTGLKKLTVAVIMLLFIAALIFVVNTYFLSSKAEVTAEEKTVAENAEVQQNKEISALQQDANDSEFKYLTLSQKDNIDISVNYLSPSTKDNDTLVFEVTLGTHSVDLTKYVDIRKYIELQTDSGVVVRDGFEWDTDSGGGHHITGILKIKNNFDGKPIVGPDTKSFKLVFKNIGSTGTREHVYEGDMLK
ncbi:MAG: hypothetical protein ACM3TR_18420 [Caulobacteraceae bacterium]